MKKILYKILQLVCTLTSITLIASCESDILNQVPKDSLTGETVWTDPQGAHSLLMQFTDKCLLVLTVTIKVGQRTLFIGWCNR
jgi:hypothetical protein